MTAAVVALAIALAALGGAAVVVAFVIRALVDRVSLSQERERAAEQEQLKQQSEMDKAAAQRDAAILKATAAQAAADRALEQLAETQQRFNAAEALLVEHVSAKMENATPEEVTAEVNRLLAGGS